MDADTMLRAVAALETIAETLKARADEREAEAKERAAAARKGRELTLLRMQTNHVAELERLAGEELKPAWARKAVFDFLSLPLTLKIWVEFGGPDPTPAEFPVLPMEFGDGSCSWHPLYENWRHKLAAAERAKPAVFAEAIKRATDLGIAAEPPPPPPSQREAMDTEASRRQEQVWQSISGYLVKLGAKVHDHVIVPDPQLLGQLYDELETDEQRAYVAGQGQTLPTKLNPLPKTLAHGTDIYERWRAKVVDWLVEHAAAALSEDDA